MHGITQEWYFGQAGVPLVQLSVLYRNAPLDSSTVLSVGVPRMATLQVVLDVPRQSAPPAADGHQSIENDESTTVLVRLPAGEGLRCCSPEPWTDVCAPVIIISTKTIFTGGCAGHVTAYDVLDLDRVAKLKVSS